MYSLIIHAQPSSNLVSSKTRKPLLSGALGTRRKQSIPASFIGHYSATSLNRKRKYNLSTCYHAMGGWARTSTEQVKKVLSVGLLGLCCITFPESANAASIQDLSPMVESWVAAAGPLGPVVFILLYGLAAVFLIPASVLTISAGFLFGPLMGTIVVSIASTFGAAMSFLIARYAARSFVEKRIRENEKFETLDKALAKQGAKGTSSCVACFQKSMRNLCITAVVFLMRLSPIFPYSLINYSLGLTKVPFLEYILASWLGMLPGTIAYTGLGAAGKAAVSAVDSQNSVTSMVFYAVGALATLGVTILLSREATKVLADEMDT